MKFKLVSFCTFAILFRFLSIATAWDFKEEMEFCCKIGRMSTEEDCKFEFYSNYDRASEECKNTFQFCCNQKFADKHCDDGIQAAKSNMSHTVCYDQQPIEFQRCCSACKMVRQFSNAQQTTCADTRKYQIPEKIQTECCVSYAELESPTTLTSFNNDTSDNSENEDSEEYPEDCDPGFLRDSPDEDCEDINECARGEHNCGHIDLCVNTLGHFYCKLNTTCSAGLEWSNVTNRCEDINECLGDHNCAKNEICINHIGYFVCETIKCPEGFEFDYYTSKCKDIDECLRHPCRQGRLECVNYEGGYDCVCHKGYRKENSHCVDIDECVENKDICTQTCVNFEGTYRCSCRRGFRMLPDNHTCDDIDECELRGKHLCTGNCLNTLGGYRCSCPTGFKLEKEYNCRDIDECATDKNICKSRETCVNTYGGHQCVNVACEKGYRKRYGTRECYLTDRTMCYNQVNSNEIEVKDSNDCKVPIKYNHHYVALKRPKYMPVEGRNLILLPMGRIYEYAVEIKDFKTTPIEKTQMKLAVKEDFKLEKRHNKVIVKLMKKLDGPQKIELYIWIKPKYTHMIAEKVIIYTSSSSIDF